MEHLQGGRIRQIRQCVRSESGVYGVRTLGCRFTRGGRSTRQFPCAGDCALFTADQLRAVSGDPRSLVGPVPRYEQPSYAPARAFDTLRFTMIAAGSSCEAKDETMKRTWVIRSEAGIDHRRQAPGDRKLRRLGVTPSAGEPCRSHGSRRSTDRRRRLSRSQPCRSRQSA